MEAYNKADLAHNTNTPHKLKNIFYIEISLLFYELYGSVLN